MVVDGWRFHFFANEGPRPHIHASKGRATAKIWLDNQSLAKWRNLTGADRRKILRIIDEHHVELLKAWNAFFESK